MGEAGINAVCRKGLEWKPTKLKTFQAEVCGGQNYLECESKQTKNCEYAHTHALISVQGEPVIGARCTLDRLIKAPISALMALYFPLTALQCLETCRRTHTAGSRSAPYTLLI